MTGQAAVIRDLYDLTAIDERARSHRERQPESDFTVVYQLLSLAYNEDIRLTGFITCCPFCSMP
jgi:NADH:ubiquinone oxidoreductase subunit C